MNLPFSKLGPMRSLLLGFLITLLWHSTLYAWPQDWIRSLHNGGALVEDSSGRTLLDYRSNDFFMPASTIKVATAACTLNNMEKDYRFPTDFYVTPDQILYVKGYGDPYLVSEELELIARELKQKGLTSVRGIRLDHTYFASNVSVDGAADSINPYDALNGALIANFNTVDYIKDKNGIRSAEAQTPLTPIALMVAQRNPSGTERVNIGKDPERGARYVGELLQAFLIKAGIKVSGTIESAAVPDSLPRFHRHLSTKSQADVLRGMLEFSTNFIANQLFLVMGAQTFGAPATVAKSQRALRDCLQSIVGWQHFTIIEGAGLSRGNQVTPRQMMALLRHFQNHRDLLPLKKTYFNAKTGTLHGVNTLVGYFDLNDGRTVRFVIMINDNVPFNQRFRLAQELRNHLNAHKP